MLKPTVGETNNGLTIIRTPEPTLGLAQIAQSIGYAAWRERMPHRPDSQQRHVFDPDNQQNTNKLLVKMKSKVGKFVGVVAILDNGPIGYAWAANDVGNLSPTRQKAKILAGKLKGQKPYAWNAHINVHPEHQGNGLGTALLHEVLSPFKNEQKATAYVFDENQITLNWFKKRGFSPRPDEPTDPNDNPDGPDIYFGEGADHVLQWRLEAPSTETVMNITGNYHNLPLYQVVEVS